MLVESENKSTHSELRGKLIIDSIFFLSWQSPSTPQLTLLVLVVFFCFTLKATDKQQFGGDLWCSIELQTYFDTYFCQMLAEIKNAAERRYFFDFHLWAHAHSSNLFIIVGLSSDSIAGKVTAGIIAVNWKGSPHSHCSDA